jgi:NAD(P)-dependent dehydrogenase (short-subunit alcohol dehydrogenase family)
MDAVSNYLIFGSTGAIGSACASQLTASGQVISASRDPNDFEKQIDVVSEFHGVIWAHGINIADSPESFEIENYEAVMAANVTFILNSLKILQNKRKLNRNSQLVVLSSVWGKLGRPDKLSYGISKAALGGLVRSIAADLGPSGIQINAVSPGPLDTPMTIKNLKPEELERVVSECPLKRLITLEEVTSVICGLVTGKLSGVTGQEIIIDGGWSTSKLV